MRALSGLILLLLCSACRQCQQGTAVTIADGGPLGGAVTIDGGFVVPAGVNVAAPTSLALRVRGDFTVRDGGTIRADWDAGIDIEADGDIRVEGNITAGDGHSIPGMRTYQGLAHGRDGGAGGDVVLRAGGSVFITGRIAGGRGGDGESVRVVPAAGYPVVQAFSGAGGRGGAVTVAAGRRIEFLRHMASGVHSSDGGPGDGGPGIYSGDGGAGGIARVEGGPAVTKDLLTMINSSDAGLPESAEYNELVDRAVPPNPTAAVEASSSRGGSGGAVTFLASGTDGGLELYAREPDGGPVDGGIETWFHDVVRMGMGGMSGPAQALGGIQGTAVVAAGVEGGRFEFRGGGTLPHIATGGTGGSSGVPGRVQALAVASRVANARVLDGGLGGEALLGRGPGGDSGDCAAIVEGGHAQRNPGSLHDDAGTPGGRCEATAP